RITKRHTLGRIAGNHIDKSEYANTGGCTQSVVIKSAASFTQGGKPGPTILAPAFSAAASWGFNLSRNEQMVRVGVEHFSRFRWAATNIYFRERGRTKVVFLSTNDLFIALGL